MSNTECDPSGNSSFPFHVGAEILDLFFLYDFSIFFHVELILRFDKAMDLSFHLKSILFVRLS